MSIKRKMLSQKGIYGPLTQNRKGDRFILRHYLTEFLKLQIFFFKLVIS